MIDVIQAAAEVQNVCQSHDWQFCFIGGLALQRWGEPRRTVDVDLSVLAGFGDEEKFADVLLEYFAARISDAVAFARERRVLLLRSTKGVGIDVALAALRTKLYLLSARLTLFIRLMFRCEHVPLKI